MTIKVGDIVRYNGKNQRVMSVYPHIYDPTFRLSCEGKSSKIRSSNVTLIESFVKPNINTGDFVHILPIPSKERSFFVNANKQIDNDVYEVVSVWESDYHGMVIDIIYNGHKHHYMAHYVEKVREYDMI